MDLSDKIKAIREAKNIKQIDVAKALELDPSYYFRLEKRGDKLTVDQLKSIAVVLGVSVMELLTGEPQAVQNDERVKELKERIGELEDRVKDKELIVKNAKNVINEILDYVETHIKESIYSLAEKHNIGTVTVEYDSGKKVSMTIQEYENDYEFEKESFSTLHTLSQSEEQYLFNQFIESDEDEFFEYFFRRGLIDDKNLLRLYEGYIEGVIKSISKRKNRKSKQKE